VHPSSTEVALLDKKLQPRQLSIRVMAKKPVDLTTVEPIEPPA
jgi:hypothetical protein